MKTHLGTKAKIVISYLLFSFIAYTYLYGFTKQQEGIAPIYDTWRLILALASPVFLVSLFVVPIIIYELFNKLLDPETPPTQPTEQSKIEQSKTEQSKTEQTTESTEKGGKPK